MTNASKTIAQDFSRERLNNLAKKEGNCDFCLREVKGIKRTEIINEKYFNDSWALKKDDNHICKFCAFCMKEKDTQRGHWYVDEDGFKRIKTSDLYDFVIDNLEGKKDFFFHLTDSPIRNQHGYLWTPKCSKYTQLTFSYNKTIVNIDYNEFKELINLIEYLRSNEFTLKEILNLKPRSKNIDSLGLSLWLKTSEFLKQYKKSTVFEPAMLISRSKKNQDKKHNKKNILEVL